MSFLKCWQGVVGISLVDGNEFVFDIREVVGGVNRGHLHASAGLDLGPSVDLNAQVLLDNVSVRIAHSDHLTFLDNFELLILGDEVDATVLITDNAFRDAVDSALVSLSLAHHFH